MRILLLCLLLAGCATVPVVTVPVITQEELEQLIGEHPCFPSRGEEQPAEVQSHGLSFDSAPHHCI